MQRRQFLATSLAATAVGANAQETAGRVPQNGGREYYELRRYRLEGGPQVKLTEEYLETALIPGLNRLGVTPVGAFRLEIGVETPSLFVLIPSMSAETLLRSEFRLREDDQYMSAAEKFLKAPAVQPAFSRIESSFMIAFEGKPKLIVPPATGDKSKRRFELRTYESPSIADHQRKVEMFHSGEFDIFKRAGFSEVFYGDVLIGPRLPKLTYMVGFPSLADRDDVWSKFSNDPQWKALTKSPKFAYESIVTNVTNVIVSSRPYSQI